MYGNFKIGDSSPFLQDYFLKAKSCHSQSLESEHMRMRRSVLRSFRVYSRQDSRVVGVIYLHYLITYVYCGLGEMGRSVKTAGKD